MEAILISVTSALDAEMQEIKSLVNELLQMLEEDIDRESLRNLLIYEKKLSSFERKASLIRDCLNEILEQGDIHFPNVNRY